MLSGFNAECVNDKNLLKINYMISIIKKKDAANQRSNKIRQQDGQNDETAQNYYTKPTKNLSTQVFLYML